MALLLLGLACWKVQLVQRNELLQCHPPLLVGFHSSEAVQVDLMGRLAQLKLCRKHLAIVSLLPWQWVLPLALAELSEMGPNWLPVALFATAAQLAERIANTEPGLSSTAHEPAELQTDGCRTG